MIKEVTILIRELEKMCLQKDFDISKAEDIMQKININQVFESSDFELDTTFLSRAVDGANYAMVELLLKHGADPNLVCHEENVLWDLQYSSSNIEEDEIRLSIVKLLLENGANPHLTIEDEDLLKWALTSWGEDEGLQSDYRFEFIKLLEKYDL
jgi:hypothetical protein